MRVPEWIILVYLAYLVCLLPFRSIPRSSRTRLLILALLGIAVVISAQWWPAEPGARLLRTWLPMPFILVGYWLTGFYFVDPQPAFEKRFVEFDERARVRFGVARLVERAPRLLLEYLEAAYFGCYIVVPLGMVAFYLAGREQEADRYWSIVLLAELACYAVLPWVRTRPPWALRPRGPFSARRVLLHELNLAFIQATSTRANTFPSGHAAGAVAAALTVWSLSPAVGLLFSLVAASIIAGSVLGEYHYAGDAFTGTAVAVAAWGTITLMGV